METQSRAVEKSYAAARASIGKRHRTRLGTVTEKEFQRFAYAIGDENDVYLDAEAARAAGHQQTVAPPLFLTSLMTWEPGPPENSLRPDGAGRTELGEVPLEGLRLMGAGQDLEFHADVIDGLEVWMELSVDDVQLKSGPSGSLLLLHLLRRYFDGDERLLVTCRETFIAR